MQLKDAPLEYTKISFSSKSNNLSRLFLLPCVLNNKIRHSFKETRIENTYLYATIDDNNDTEHDFFILMHRVGELQMIQGMIAIFRDLKPTFYKTNIVQGPGNGYYFVMACKLPIHLKKIRKLIIEGDYTKIPTLYKTFILNNVKEFIKEDDKIYRDLRYVALNPKPSDYTDYAIHLNIDEDLLKENKSLCDIPNTSKETICLMT